MLKRLLISVWLVLNLVAISMWFRYELLPDPEPWGFVGYLVAIMLLNAPISFIAYWAATAVILFLGWIAGDYEKLPQSLIFGCVSIAFGWYQWFILPGVIKRFIRR